MSDEESFFRRSTDNIVERTREYVNGLISKYNVYQREKHLEENFLRKSADEIATRTKEYINDSVNDCDADQQPREREKRLKRRLKEIKKLAHVLSLYRDHQKPKWYQKYRIRIQFAIFFVIAGFLAFLLLFHISDTSIRLDMYLSKIDFTLGDKAKLSDSSIALKNIAVSGLSEKEILEQLHSHSHLCISDCDEKIERGSSIYFSRVDTKDTNSKITWHIDDNNNSWSEGTRVLLEFGKPYTNSESDSKIKMKIIRPKKLNKEDTYSVSSTRISLEGKIKIASRVYDLTEDTISVTLDFNKKGRQIQFVFQASEKTPLFKPNVLINELCFISSSNEQKDICSQPSSNEKANSNDKISSLLKGTLYFDDLIKNSKTDDFSSRERKFGNGEWLHLDKLEEGEIRSLKLVKLEDPDDQNIMRNAIRIEFSGRVKGITMGRDGDLLNLMPNLFEYLQAKHSVQAVWAALLSLFGIALAVYRGLHK